MPGFDKPQCIYIGFGACYILTQAFISEVMFLDEQSFLMGEEVFLAHQIRIARGKLFYDPSLAIRHIDSATFKLYPNRLGYDCQKAAFEKYVSLL